MAQLRASREAGVGCGLQLCAGNLAYRGERPQRDGAAGAAPERAVGVAHPGCRLRVEAPRLAAAEGSCAPELFALAAEALGVRDAAGAKKAPDGAEELFLVGRGDGGCEVSH